MTPLHLAVINQDQKIVHLLLTNEKINTKAKNLILHDKFTYEIYLKMH